MNDFETILKIKGEIDDKIVQKYGETLIETGEKEPEHLVEFIVALLEVHYFLKGKHGISFKADLVKTFEDKNRHVFGVDQKEEA